MVGCSNDPFIQTIPFLRPFTYLLLWISEIFSIFIFTVYVGGKSGDYNIKRMTHWSIWVILLFSSAPLWRLKLVTQEPLFVEGNGLKLGSGLPRNMCKQNLILTSENGHFRSVCRSWCTFWKLTCISGTDAGRAKEIIGPQVFVRHTNELPLPFQSLWG